MSSFLAEGCRGSLAESVIHHYKLRDQCQPQTYALGLKEIWKIQPEYHRLGHVHHTVEWPLDSKTEDLFFIIWKIIKFLLEW